MPIRFFLLLLSVVLSVWGGQSRASTAAVRFKSLTIEQGLSQNTVLAIYQDRQGFMWFGTADGLNRFDGYQFKQFRHDDKDQRSLSNNLITVLHEDIRGSLWVGTEGGGLLRYDRYSQSFERFAYEGKPGELTHGHITAISEDSQGRLWIGTRGGGVNLFDVGTGQFSYLRHEPGNPNSLSHDKVWSVISDRSGIVWIGTDGGGLNRYDPKTKQFTRYYHTIGNTQGLNHNQVNVLYEDSKSRLWVGTHDGLNLLDKESGQFEAFIHDPDEPFSIGGRDVRTIIEDDLGALWVGTYGGGLNQFIVDKRQFIHYRHQASDPDSISNDIVLSTFQDATGLLWIGTWAGGVNKIDIGLRRFGHYKHDINDPGSLNHNDVSAVFVDTDNTLWVGTRGGGLNRQMSTESGFAHFRHDQNDPNSIGSNIVRHVTQDGNGHIWVSTFDGGLNRFDAKTEGFVRFNYDPQDPDSLSHDDVQVVLPDKDGTLWIGTWGGGLNHYSPQTGKFTHYRFNGDDPGTISDDDVEALYLDKDNHLWVGTWGGGLNLFDRTSQSFTRFLHDKSDSSSISNNNILSIFQGADGQLWVGTYGGGLNVLQPETKTFKHFSESDGLPNNAVYGILQDRFNNLWLSTNRGICKFNPQTNSYRSYGPDDGLQSYEFNLGAYYQAFDGEMFFGGINGFNRFYPDDITADIHMPMMAFTDFLLFNQSVPIQPNGVDQQQMVLSQAIDALGSIDLDYRQSLVSIEFAALDFRSPMKNQYVYTLEGLDDKWIQSDARIRRASYTNLPSGSYTLRVKAGNADRVWNHEGIAIEVNVAPPPWFSWWAWCIYLMLALLLVYLFVSAERNKVLRERAVNLQLKRVNKLKDEFLANTSHELRTPLNGIIGLTESLMDGATGPLSGATHANLAMVVSSARRLSNLVNDILDFSQLQNRHLNLNTKALDLHSMVEVVVALSKPLVGDKHLILQNMIPDNIPAVEADEDRLMQILHNLVGNAIKFTDEGEILISATVKERQLRVDVTDTGIGIAKDKLERIFESFEQLHGSEVRQYSGTGLGLAVTKQLVELHGGIIEASSEPGRGSVFSFTLAQSDKAPCKAQVTEQLSRVHHFTDIEAEFELPNTQGAKFSILLVDDEPVNRQVLFNHLSLQQSYRLVEAQSGPEALQLMQDEGPFDLVLLDIMMPRMSGYEVCKKLREQYSMSELPVIFLTAKNQVADLVQSFAVGANDYLSKPVSKYELLSRVETHLRLLDVTRTLERKVAKRSNELVHSEKMASLGTLTAGIAHEINNPTNFVHVSSQNLAADLQSCRRFILDLAGETADKAIVSSIEQQFNPLYEHLETISDGTERLMNIVKDLKTFTQQDIDDKNMVDVRASLQSTINLVQAQKHPVAQFIKHFKTIPEISCYPAQLNQVFMNLLVNACDAIEKRIREGDRTPGIIEVGCNLGDKCIEITFKDNGCGMSKETRSKLFEPFYTTKAVGKGTGLGLSIAYGIIEKHHGRLTVESEPGQGALFIIQLPL